MISYFVTNAYCNSKVPLTRGLAGVDANAVVSDDGRGLRSHLELLGGELQHRSERRRVGHAQTGGQGWVQGGVRGIMYLGERQGCNRKRLAREARDKAVSGIL